MKELLEEVILPMYSAMQAKMRMHFAILFHML